MGFPVFENQLPSGLHAQDYRECPVCPESSQTLCTLGTPGLIPSSSLDYGHTCLLTSATLSSMPDIQPLISTLIEVNF